MAVELTPSEVDALKTFLAEKTNPLTRYNGVAMTITNKIADAEIKAIEADIAEKQATAAKIAAGKQANGGCNMEAPLAGSVPCGAGINRPTYEEYKRSIRPPWMNAFLNAYGMPRGILIDDRPQMKFINPEEHLFGPSIFESILSGLSQAISKVEKMEAEEKKKHGTDGLKVKELKMNGIYHCRLTDRNVQVVGIQLEPNKENGDTCTVKMWENAGDGPSGIIRVDSVRDYQLEPVK